MTYSRQRNLIFNIVRNTDVHPTAEWVYEQAKLAMPTIGIATVYRNLNALSQTGLLARIVSPDGTIRFDGSTEEHYHMQCRKCGQLFDLSVVDREAFDELKEAASRAFGMEVENIVLAATLFYGMCPRCAEEKEEEENHEGLKRN